MSLILDALKRAESERPGAPVLPAGPGAPGPAPSGRRWRWRLAGLVLLAGIAGALAWTLMRKPPAPTDVPAPPATASPPLRTTPAPAEVSPPPAASDPEASAMPPVIPGTESVASLEEITEGVIEPLPPPAIAPPPQPEPSRTEAPQPAAAAEPPALAAPQPQPQAGLEEAEQAPARPIPPALTQPAPLRKLREMPPDYRADFPALAVQVHVYERDVAQRFVLVNGRRYKEGERLAEGPQLLEIVREGMVLEHRGQKVLFTLGR